MRTLKVSVLTVALMGFALAASAAEYSVDPAHTEVTFKVSHLGLSKVSGKFKKFDGTVTFVPGEMSKWSVSGTIDAASIDTGVDKRDDHLRSADFFHVEEYPKLKFESKSFKKRDEGYVTVGDLTIHGVTREVELPFTFTGPIKDPWGNERIGANASLTIDRRDYGLEWNKVIETGGLVVGHDVEIELHGEFVRPLK